MTPGLKTDCASGPVEYACIYVCVPECACVYAGDGWTGRTEDGEIGGFTCVHVCMCVCACVRDAACVRVTLCARME